MGKNGLKWEFGLVFYKFAENREFFQGRFLPYKLGIETPASSSSPPPRFASICPGNDARDGSTLHTAQLTLQNSVLLQQFNKLKRIVTSFGANIQQEMKFLISAFHTLQSANIREILENILENKGK